MAALSANGNDARRRWLTLLIGAATIAITIIGWRVFWFLTDDAYIAFRYVSNSLVGRGLVWNPAPFKPVEGYTSFLWVVILREVWRITGIAPPDCANFLSLLCGFATLYLGLRLVLRLALPAALDRWRLVLLALVLLGTATNRTFLAWLSSGLETSLFNLLFTWWVYEGTARQRGSLGWTLRLTSSAALCALCRPDGLLIVAATAAMLVLDRPRWPGLAPLLAVPAHLLWRHATYGEWLPNTYYAKHTSAWPDAGLRYLASFVIEYGVWWWIGLAVGGLAFRVRRGVTVDSPTLARAVPVATLVAHVAYYTLIIGGDHFEYRVYSHLILLLFVSGAWLVAQLPVRGGAAAGLLAGFLLASYPIPWLHWARTHDLTQRRDTYALAMRLSDSFPWPFKPVVAQWDDWQAWLSKHLIGLRHQEHKVYWQTRISRYPSRDEGLRISWSDRDTYGSYNVGMVGWILPNVAVIDKLGLNDRVIARIPPPPIPESQRQMAHERRPPPGFVDCFRPNVIIRPSGITVEPRATPLTDDDIRACESRDWPTQWSTQQAHVEPE